MKKRIFAMMLTIIMIMSTGCQLAQEERENGTALTDRLVGVFITTEHLDLFDIEAYLKDNWNGQSELFVGDSSDYQNRIYAQRDAEDPSRYTFEGLEGILYANFHVVTELENYWASSADEGLCDVRNHTSVTDQGTDLELEATIYLSTEGEEKVFFLNPVYQTEAGDVYLMAGTGCNYDPEMGGSVSQTMSDSRSYVREGVVQTDSINIKITVEAVALPETLALIQMDEDHQELARQECVPGQMPKDFTPAEGCAYILVEQILPDGTVVRSISQPGDEEKYIKAYFDRGDGICLPDTAEVLWNG